MGYIRLFVHFAVLVEASFTSTERIRYYIKVSLHFAVRYCITLTYRVAVASPGFGGIWSQWVWGTEVPTGAQGATEPR